MVASKRSGIASKRLMAQERGDSSSSSACCGVMEKYAISLPLTNPETNSATKAQARATICATPKLMPPIVAKGRS